MTSAESVTEAPLIAGFDTVLFDLDGVLYAGSEPIPKAAETTGRLRERGTRLAYVTNNAAHPPDAVAGKLTAMGIPAEPTEVVTSAQATAKLLADRLPAGARVLVVGGAGLVDALESYGLAPVFAESDGPVAVAQGFHPTVGWAQLAEGAYAVARGLTWVASNTDRTLPTDRGLAPGNGALIETLRIATGRNPEVAGKPERPLFDQAIARTGAERALVVGDRLDTDIAGASAAGLPSLLVLTGVSRVSDLLAAPPGHRPTYLGSDLDTLCLPYAAPELDGRTARCGGWVVRLRDGAVALDGDGGRDEALRALAAFAWSHADGAGLDFSRIDLAGE